MKKFKTVADCSEKLISEWDIEANHGLLPCEVSANSNMNAFWRLPSGEIYQECISNKTKDEITKRLEYPSYLIDEFDSNKNIPHQLSDFKMGSNKNVWWVCSKGHSYQSIIKNRVRGSNCPYCHGKKVNSHNCLAKVFPKIAADWHPIKNSILTPYQVTAFSSKKVWWNCDKGHTWSTNVNNRTKGSNCPLCSLKVRNSRN